MSLSIVVPTIGRVSLVATLVSIGRQSIADDRIIVASDGRNDITKKFVSTMAATYPGDWNYVAVPTEHGGNYGHGIRNYVAKQYIDSTHWATIDDDDVYTPDALRAMRDACGEHPAMFKAKWGPGHPAHGAIVWFKKEVIYGNVATCCIVAPTCEARFGLRYEGDYDYALELQYLFGEFNWREEVIAEVRP